MTCLDNRLNFWDFSLILNLIILIQMFFALVVIGKLFSITILEAMSASLPVVLSNIGGCNEIVLHGFNGYLFSKRSSRLNWLISWFVYWKSRS